MLEISSLRTSTLSDTLSVGVIDSDGIIYNWTKNILIIEASNIARRIVNSLVKILIIIFYRKKIGLLMKLSGSEIIIKTLADLKSPPNGGRPLVTRSKELEDPWKKPYIYQYPGTRNTGSYDLSTTAPDGTVIGNWETEK